MNVISADFLDWCITLVYDKTVAVKCHVSERFPLHTYSFQYFSLLFLSPIKQKVDAAFNGIVKKKFGSCTLTSECLLLYFFFLLIGIIAANVFVFCLWRLPGMRRMMFTYFTSNPSSSKRTVYRVAFLQWSVTDTAEASGGSQLSCSSITHNQSLSHAQTHCSV